MPCIARAETVGGIYHIINHGNMQMQVFGPLYERIYKNIELLNAPYMKLNSNWTECVNENIHPKELVKIHNSVNRQVLLGEEQWQQETAARFGLTPTLNQRGRPRKDDT